ncbi:type II toxin-antitoxin system RelE/ParE family toxin [Spirulina sp. CCNP1310]|uniref:type II toxin-antitoxin system RelE/ParE family toxin n=1 Tax=Spirulina sp. CCNP1310 TaxID=3110249 RepID=UPI002B1F698E|nr:type II toxin-antitoxin system RelE/ParE family toxin [Spirulina sp. CCNP1310]MEA5420354.1 type II toxin-antitoxin system RelE/ParE family toxin [Spirulina sp. CCNP1310]
MTDPLWQVELSPTFIRKVRTLKKRYPSIQQDLEPIIQQLQAGEMLGDQIPGVGNPAFKVRIRNRDIQKGKSAGYRLIYYVKMSQKIVLLTLYSKSDQSDITPQEIREILAE